jgi:hypothetical protein
MKCKDCNGTGADPKKTEVYMKTISYKMQGGHIRCWTCNGNGLEPTYPNSQLYGETT